MAGNRYPKVTKDAVLRLAKAGKTYAQIQQQYLIPKSTLSAWFNALGRGQKMDRTRQIEHLKRARVAAAAAIKRGMANRRAEAQVRANEVVKNVPLAEKSVRKSLLAMLYWAEGTKSDPGSLIFVNTDPVLASFYLRLLRSTFPIIESKIRIRLHVSYYHSHRTAKAFWSKLLDIPESQFGKIHVKKRSTRKKFRKNFQGICFIVYGDSSILREVLALGRLLAQKLDT